MQIPDNSQRTSHGRVAGPMGRPAVSGETPRGTVVPRGPKTPPPREPPPEAQKLTSCRTESDRNPRNILAQRLAGSLSSKNSNKKTRQDRLTSCRQHPYRYTEVSAHHADNLPVLEPLPGGAHEEGAGPILPHTSCSGIFPGSPKEDGCHTSSDYQT